MSLPHLHFTSLSAADIFGEIIETYRRAAEKLGYSTSYLHSCVDPNHINIIFFGWGLCWEKIKEIHPRCITVNFEPLVAGSHAWRPEYIDILKRGYSWEYSRSNYQSVVGSEKFNCDWVPMKFDDKASQTLDIAEILPESEKDIDVVFFGSYTERRTTLLNELRRRGLNIAASQTPWTLEERTDRIKRAKIALNFHNWEQSRVVEQSRLHILLRHHKAVVCEVYPDSEILPELREAVVPATYEQLIDTVFELLTDKERRDRLEKTAYAALQRIPPQELCLGPVLERYLRWLQLQSQHLPTAAANVLEKVQVHITPTRTIPSPSTTKTGPRFCVTSEHGAQPTNSPAIQEFPAGSGIAARRNYAIVSTQGCAYIVFAEIPEAELNERLRVQAQFMDEHPELDIVGCNWSSPDSEQKYPERDHHIKADFLGSTPLTLQVCMFRLSFLKQHGLRFDAEFDDYRCEHQFLVKCIAAGAHFYVLPNLQAKLNESPATFEKSYSTPISPEQSEALNLKLYSLLLSAYLPGWSSWEIKQLSFLYAHQWEPSAQFALKLLLLMGKACTQTTFGCGAEQGTLARTLGREAIRLLQVFNDAGLINQDWINEAYTHPEIAFLLSPISKLLPLQPSA